MAMMALDRSPDPGTMFEIFGRVPSVGNVTHQISKLISRHYGFFVPNVSLSKIK